MATRPEAAKFLSEPYSRVLVPDPSGGYFAEVLELTGCFSQGDTAEEAIKNLEEAMVGWISSALDAGEPIPPPLAAAGYSGRVLLRLPKSLHKAAVRRAELEGVSLNQYLVATIAAHLTGDDLADRIAKRLSRTLTFTQVTQLQVADTAKPQVPVIRPSSLGELQKADNAGYEPLFPFVQRKERQYA